MIALIPVVGKYIVLGISALLIFTVSNNFLIIAAFAACMVIFVFPLFLLGTVTPSLVKYAVDVANTTNRELFASNNPSIMENLQANTQQIANADLRNMMETVYADSTPYAKGDYILTDDKAPVELLGMQVIDQLIEEEVAYYKGIYERDGIQGVLNSL